MSAILFLDFDGVLNGTETIEAMSPTAAGLFLNVARVGRLNSIIARTGADVVLSTSWRYHAGLAKCDEALRAVGFVGNVIGMTPDFRSSDPYADRRTYTPQSDEIRAWLKAHPVDAFVVLDDHGDCEVDDRTVRTNTRFGLSAEDVERAVAILEGR